MIVKHNNIIVNQTFVWKFDLIENILKKQNKLKIIWK